MSPSAARSSAVTSCTSSWCARTQATGRIPGMSERAPSSRRSASETARLSSCQSFWSRLPRSRRLLEPICETRLGEMCVCAGEECAFAQFGAEVARASVGDYLAPIAPCGKVLSDQFVESELLGARDLDHVVHRSADGYLGHLGSDIVRGHGLDQHRWESDLVTRGSLLGDALDELEELRRVHNRVRD